MANIDVGELIVVSTLPIQIELDNKSITVDGITKIFDYPVVFRTISGGSSVDYTYLNATDKPKSSFNPNNSLIKSLDIVNGVLFGVKITMYVPNGVTLIKEESFSNSQIKELSLPESVIVIEVGGFSSNIIENLVLPNNLISMGIIGAKNSFSINGAFKSNALTSIVIPPKVILIGDNTFASNILQTVVFNQVLEQIGRSAFSGNSIIGQIIFPNSLISIASYAFSNNQITAVTLPTNCTYLSTSFDAGVVITGGTLIV